MKSPNIKKNLLKVLERNGARIGNASKAVGIHRSTFYDFMKRDKRFKQRARDIIEAAADTMESALYRTALDGNVTAQIFYLKNKRPSEWMEVNYVNVQAKVETDCKAHEEERLKYLEEKYKGIYKL